MPELARSLAEESGLTAPTPLALLPEPIAPRFGVELDLTDSLLLDCAAPDDGRPILELWLAVRARLGVFPGPDIVLCRLLPAAGGFGGGGIEPGRPGVLDREGG